MTFDIEKNVSVALFGYVFWAGIFLEPVEGYQYYELDLSIARDVRPWREACGCDSCDSCNPREKDMMGWGHLKVRGVVGEFVEKEFYPYW